tara:strand:- start:1500 stop:1673 length:174 start_codon:yes stop_codon:yes gene_type:complete
MSQKFMKMKLDGQTVIVVKGDASIDYTGKTVVLLNGTFILDARLPIHFSNSAVWSIA